MFGIIFESYAKFLQKVSGPILRSIGKSMYVKGAKIEASIGSEDRLVPSLRNLNYLGASPNLEGAQFVAPNATILGKVNLGNYTSVWYGATLLGTKGITIGNHSIIQDRTHISNQVKIGNFVFVGPNCVIQGSQLADRSFVSMGATVRHAKVQSGALVAAGAVILDSSVVKEGEIWAGNPGKFLRNITPIQRQILNQHLEQMRDLAIIHAEQTEKNSRELISGKNQPFEMALFEQELQKMYSQSKYGDDLPISELDDEFVERRVMMRQTPKYFDSEKDYEPFQHNLAHMGEKVNLGVHHEAYKKVAAKIVKKERFHSDDDAWTKPY